MAKMTPGPWIARWNNSDNGVIGFQIFGRGLQRPIAEVPNIRTPHGDGEANARAIAALPELIEAAERLANAYFKIAMPDSVDYGDYLSMRRILARRDKAFEAMREALRDWIDNTIPRDSNGQCGFCGRDIPVGDQCDSDDCLGVAGRTALALADRVTGGRK